MHSIGKQDVGLVVGLKPSRSHCEMTLNLHMSGLRRWSSRVKGIIWMVVARVSDIGYVRIYLCLRDMEVI